MENRKGRGGGRNGTVVFSSRHMKVVHNFFFLRRFVFTTNHVPVLPFSPSPRPIRPSRYLSAVLALCSLTSDSKYNILPFRPPPPSSSYTVFLRLFLRAAPVREWGDLGYPRSDRGMSS